MAERNPKLEFEKGKKYKITIKDGFNGESYDQKKNDGSTRPWYAFNLFYGDTLYTSFIDKTAWDEFNRYSEGSIIEVTDKDESPEHWRHDWDIKAIGNSNPLDKQMADSKKETEIKIQTYASMKIAAAISSNMDELKVNTHSVMALHKQICDGVKNEEELFDD